VSKPLVEVAIALVCRGTRWLVAKRRADTHLGGFWEFPGGKRKPNEPPAAAAIRELHEECGVDAVAERVLQPVDWEYPDRYVSITAVLCRWRDGEAQPLGCEACRWVSLTELRELDMPPLNAAIIRQLEQCL
jgi:8-oxo-dGTP diphosphatase